MDRRSKAFLIWSGDDDGETRRIVDNLVATFVNCPADVRAGYLRKDNVVAFYQLDVARARRLVFDRFETRHHHHVTTFSSVDRAKGPSGGLLMSRYDIYRDSVVASSVWRDGKGYSGLRHMFPFLPMRGYQLRV